MNAPFTKQFRCHQTQSKATHMFTTRYFISVLIAFTLFVPQVRAQTEGTQAADKVGQEPAKETVQESNQTSETTPAQIEGDLEEAVEAAVQAYASAFNSHDPEKSAQLWTEGGVYTIQPSGDQVVGRDSIQKEFKELFAEDPQRKLVLETEQMQQISPSVVLAAGVAIATSSDQEAIVTTFQAILVLSSGQWLVDQLAEDESADAENQNEALQPLQWLIGQWKDQVEDELVEIECNWSANQTFITRAYAVYEGEQVDSSGLEIIGWDPRQEKIRSWLFDSDGTLVQGIWTQAEDRWIVQSVATLSDGTAGSYTSVYRPLSDDSYGWQKINQVVDGKLLPNLDEVAISRKQNSESDIENN